jgi:primosomal protein N' (replication factor Y)
MEGFDAPGPSGRPAIGVMTRGSVVHRPAWLGDDVPGSVVLPDADAFLGRPALDAAEDALRLFFAVARWAGSGTDGEVLLQTREPNHPAVQALVRWDPDGFWEREVPRRAELRYPPVASLLRVDAPPDTAREVVAELRAALPAGDDVLGPDPTGAALVKSMDLRGTLGALTPLRHAWSKADRKVRLDVDPDTID